MRIMFGCAALAIREAEPVGRRFCCFWSANAAALTLRNVRRSGGSCGMDLSHDCVQILHPERTVLNLCDMHIVDDVAVGINLHDASRWARGNIAQMEVVVAVRQAL